MIRYMALAIISFTLAACGGGGGGSTPANTPPAVQSGQFIDSAVEGVRYVTATQSGITDSNGTFTYLAGEAVSFYIGDILIGVASGATQVTPIDFVAGATDATNAQVTHILRFVQSLDSDNNPDNGITISSLVATQASGQTLDFTLPTGLFDVAANALLNVLTSGSVTTLISASAAQAHFNGSISGGGGGSGNNGLTLSGPDTGVLGTSFTPESNVVNGGVFGVNWRTDNFGNVTGAGASFDVTDIIQNDGNLDDKLTFVVTFPSTPNESHIYTLDCFNNRSACAGVTLDLANKTITLSNVSVPVAIVSFTTNVATAPLVLNGELVWQ